MGKLDGKVALVTGASRGQGAAEARLFVEEGASVVLADVLHEEGTALAAELGSGACFQHLDVRDEDGWRAAVAEAVGRFGGLSILVNNAGIFRFSPLEGTTREVFDEVVAVNQTGVFLGMQAVAGPMRAAGGGSIINVSSVDGLVGMTYGIAYVASKFAVRGMTKCAALELAGAGIRVNSIHPGGVDTPMANMVPGVDVASAFSNVPLGRIGRPEEIARLVAFLASDDSSYCTGSEFIIDGGMTAGMQLEQLLAGAGVDLGPLLAGPAPA